MTAVGVSALEAGYGSVPVLFDLNLQVPSGLFLAVLGTSGSGKVTSARRWNRLVSHDGWRRATGDGDTPADIGLSECMIE